MLIYADTETRSEVDLKSAGVYRYAEHPSTRVQLFSYMPKGHVRAKVWSPEEGESIPTDLLNYLLDPNCVFLFHNAQFDRIVLRTLPDVPELPIERFRCMMIQAMSHSLPGSLEDLGNVIGISEERAKIKDGKRLVQLFCKPLKDKATGLPIWRTYETHPEDWLLYKEYCRRDTEVLQDIHRKLPAFNYPKVNELAYWFLDQRMNDRGMPIDMELVDAAIRAVDLERVRLNKLTREKTFDNVDAATQRDALLAHLKETYGVDMDDMTKATVELLLDDPDTDPKVRELLEIRQASSTSSTAKFSKMRKVVCSDNRIRGAIQFNGAKRTGRDAGRMVQPQNFPSRGLLKEKEVEIGIEALKLDGAYDLGFDVMKLATSTLRYAIAAPQGKKLVIADLSAIEGRALAYVAEEDWKVQAYRECDLDPDAPDLYKLAYAKSFGVDPKSVTKDQRQIGKVLELACLGSETLVLTEKRGWIPIVGVSSEDRVWDGVEWVQNKGAVYRGYKWVMALNGVEVTGEHLIKIGKSWRAAEEMDSNVFMNFLALATALVSLPLKVLIMETLEGLKRGSFSVPVAQNHITFTPTTLGKEPLPGVMYALKRLPARISKNILNTRRSYRTTITEGGSVIGFHPPLAGATIQKLKGLKTTEEEGFASTKLGGRIKESSLNTLLLLTDGTILLLNLIGSITIRGTSQETFGSYLKKRTASIKERLKSCLKKTKNSEKKTKNSEKKTKNSEKKAHVYDLLYSGPRSCFTILTNKGPLIVHNCGYAGGVGAFVNFASAFKINLVELGEKVAPTIPNEVWGQAVGLFDFMNKVKGRTFNMDERTFAAIDSLKRLWRLGHPNICQFWEDSENAVRMATYEKKEGSTYPFGKNFFAEYYKKWVLIHMPSGRRLCYPAMRMDDKGKLSFQGENQFSKKWEYVDTFGGKITENSVQAISRDFFKHGQQLAEDKRYEVVLVVHDELVTEVPDNGLYTVGELEQCMSTQPPWALDMPLNAKGFETYRYHKED